MVGKLSAFAHIGSVLPSMTGAYVWSSGLATAMTVYSPLACQGAEGRGVWFV